ncbi:class I SAM-dependent methyltransferase [Streptomyces sp. NPDC057743]|uniref:class I SAM-dependent methyltransferase n=1 Tax=Streptomyces sp. NPDC057743 TaxID=3346236 RepID=UPI00368CBCC4
MKHEVNNPRFARMYPRLAAWAEANGAQEHRAEALAPASGQVLEIGAGHGLNFPHYPSAVSSVTAVEPEATLRDLAEEAAHRASVPVTVVDGIAEQLPAADDAFDTVVCSMVLCSVRDLAAALSEIHRVLRPDGRLCFYEHVRARTAGFARYQRAVDLLWPHISGGCRVSRRTEIAITQAGFTMKHLRRFRFPEGRNPAPTAPFVIGLAQPR